MNKQKITNQCKTLLTQIKTYVPEDKEIATLLHDSVEKIMADVAELIICQECCKGKAQTKSIYDPKNHHNTACGGHGLMPSYGRNPPSHNSHCRDCFYYRYYDSHPAGARCSRGKNNYIHENTTHALEGLHSSAEFEHDTECNGCIHYQVLNSHPFAATCGLGVNRCIYKTVKFDGIKLSSSQVILDT